MLRRAIALNPNYAPAHQWLGGLLFGNGRRNESLTSVERAVALDPLSAVINNSLGGARESVGRFDDALAAYKQAIEIDPKMTSPYWGIGFVYAYGLGRWDTAMPWFEKVASLDPGDPEAPAALGYAHWQLGDDTEVAQWLAQMPASGERTAWTNHEVAALLYLDRGDEAAARKHAQLAAEMNQPSLYLIRDDDLRKGDYTRARARYAKAFPDLFAKELPRLTYADAFKAIDLALVLQHTGEGERAKVLLDRSEAHLRTIPRMGGGGYGITDVAIHALRGRQVHRLGKVARGRAGGLANVVALPPRLRPPSRLDPQRARVQGHLRRHRARHGATARPTRRAPEGCAARADGRFEVTATPTEPEAESTWTTLRRRKDQAVVDGEIVALDAQGQAVVPGAPASRFTAGHQRHAAFLGLRTDKSAREVRKEA